MAYSYILYIHIKTINYLLNNLNFNVKWGGSHLKNLSSYHHWTFFNSGKKYFMFSIVKSFLTYLYDFWKFQNVYFNEPIRNIHEKFGVDIFGESPCMFYIMYYIGRRALEVITRTLLLPNSYTEYYYIL